LYGILLLFWLLFLAAMNLIKMRIANSSQHFPVVVEALLEPILQHFKKRWQLIQSVQADKNKSTIVSERITYEVERK
jgi:hypothetical protein